MSRKHDARGRSKGGPAYAQLFHWIRKTDAWRSLSVYARCLYIEIRGRYNGSNNGDIPMSYRDAQELLACSNRPILEAFRQLQDRGFIKPVEKGAFTWKVRFEGKGRATTWLLTELAQDYPERSLSPSYEFKAWTPADEPKSKTRRAESIPMACREHTIKTPMACREHTNGVPKARHSRQNAQVDGMPRARTSNIPYTPTPVGDVSRALLNTPIMRAAKAAASREGQ